MKLKPFPLFSYAIKIAFITCLFVRGDDNSTAKLSIDTLSREDIEDLVQLQKSTVGTAKKRIFEALLANDSRVVDTSQYLFGWYSNEDFYRAGPQNPDSLGTKFQWAKQIFDPRLWKTHKKNLEQALSLTPQEEVALKPIIEEGFKYRDEFYQSLWRTSIQEDSILTPLYKKVQNFYQPKTLPVLTRRTVPLTHLKATLLAHSEFEQKYRQSPDEASVELQRDFQKLVHRYETFHEEQKLNKETQSLWPSKKDLLLNVNELLAEIKKINLMEEDELLEKIRNDIQNPLKNYSTLYAKNLIDQIKTRLELTRSQLGSNLLSAEEIMEKQSREFKAISSFDFAKLCERPFTMDYFLADKKFANFVNGAKWAGLKRSPHYWTVRDAEAAANSDLFRLKKSVHLVRVSLKHVIANVTLFGLALSKLSVGVGGLVIGSYILNTGHLPQFNFSSGQRVETKKSPVKEFLRDKFPWLFSGKPDDKFVHFDSDLSDPCNSCSDLEKQSGRPLFYVSDKNSFPLEERMPFVYSTKDHLMLDEHTYLYNLPKKTHDFDIKLESNITFTGNDNAIPTPPGHRLVALDYSRRENHEFHVFQIGLGKFQIEKQNSDYKDLKNVTAYFKRDLKLVDFEEGERNFHLNNIDRPKLSEISKKLREAKMTTIANALKARLQNPKPIGVMELSLIIGENSVYKLSASKNHAQLISGNKYSIKFNENIVEGVLHAKCDFGNELLFMMLEDLDLPQYIKFRRTGELLAEDGILKFPGHSELEIFVGDKLVMRPDATPRILGPEFQNLPKPLIPKRITKKSLEPDDPFIPEAKEIQHEQDAWIADRRKSMRSSELPLIAPTGILDADNKEREFQRMLAAQSDSWAEETENWRNVWQKKFQNLNHEIEKAFREAKVNLAEGYPHVKMLRLSNAISEVLEGKFEPKRLESILGRKISDIDELRFVVTNFINKEHAAFLYGRTKTLQDPVFRRKFGDLFTDKISKILFDKQGPILEDFLSELNQRMELAEIRKFNPKPQETSKAISTSHSINECTQFFQHLKRI